MSACPSFPFLFGNPLGAGSIRKEAKEKGAHKENNRCTWQNHVPWKSQWEHKNWRSRTKTKKHFCEFNATALYEIIAPVSQVAVTYWITVPFNTSALIRLIAQSALGWICHWFIPWFIVSSHKHWLNKITECTLWWYFLHATEAHTNWRDW